MQFDKTLITIINDLLIYNISPTVTLHGACDEFPLLCGLWKVDPGDREEVLDRDEASVHLRYLLSTDTAACLTLDASPYKYREINILLTPGV